MYNALLEAESFTDIKILHKINAKISHKENHPDQITKEVTVYTAKIDDGEIDKIMNFISQHIKDEWYALFWNEENVYLVFKDKILHMKNNVPWIKKEYNAIMKYALSHGIQKKHIENLRATLNNHK